MTLPSGQGHLHAGDGETEAQRGGGCLPGHPVCQYPLVSTLPCFPPSWLGGSLLACCRALERVGLSPTARVQIQTLPLADGVALGKFLKLLTPPGSHPKPGTNPIGLIK